MKVHNKKYFLFSIINICFFSLSCFLSSFLWSFKIDSFCGQLIDSVQRVTNTIEEKYPLVSITSKDSSYDYKNLFSSVNYNMYVPYYRCNADTIIKCYGEEIKVTIISQPSFWSTPYTQDGTEIYKLDYSAYYVKHKSEYNSHGTDAFFYYSQSLATYLCDKYNLSEDDLLSNVVEFTDRKNEIKTAYVSNIVIDGMGLSDCQTKDKGFFVLSYVLFDPRINSNFDARFDIRMKMNTRGNSSVLNTCLDCCPKDEYKYDFFTYAEQSKRLDFNDKLSDSFACLEKNNEILIAVGLYTSAALFSIYELSKIILYKRNYEFSFISSIIPVSLFCIFGLVACFYNLSYLFGLFALIYFALDFIFVAEKLWNRFIFKLLHSTGKGLTKKDAISYQIEI